VATPAPRPRAYLTFLLITRVTTWLRLSRRDEAWKIAEILILRHQLAVLQRQQTHRPKLNWADRALLAALLGVIPQARRNLREYETHHNQHRPHRALDAAAPLKPLPEPVDLLHADAFLPGWAAHRFVHGGLDAADASSLPALMVVWRGAAPTPRAGARTPSPAR
jgi:hypothetical protein